MASAHIESSTGFRSCVHSFLAREKRSAAIESLLGGFVYTAFAIVFFAVAVYFVSFFTLAFVFPMLHVRGISPFKTSAFFILLLSALGWKRLSSGEFNPHRI